MNLARFDMNLLLVFEALLIERNVTQAGQRLHLSQSATSSALRRLREATNDELFVRSADGMLPTPRALELAEPLRRALSDVRSALDGAAFDPATAVRTFTIAASDYDVALHIPRLAQLFSRDAPGIDLRVLPHSNVDAIGMVDTAQVDVALGWFPRAPQRLHLQLLIEESFVCVMRRGHPLSDGLMSLEGYANAAHLLITLVGDTSGAVDDILREKGLSRRVAMTIPHFAAAPMVLAHSDLVAALPKRIANRFAEQHGLVVRSLPFKSYVTAHELLWHPRVDRHPAHVWLRQVLIEVIR
ncbi:MAG: LysR family transcriptional regulator [Pseudomonadota bacterium]